MGRTVRSRWRRLPARPSRQGEHESRQGPRSRHRWHRQMTGDRSGRRRRSSTREGETQSSPVAFCRQWSSLGADFDPAQGLRHVVAVMGVRVLRTSKIWAGGSKGCAPVVDESLGNGGMSGPRGIVDVVAPFSYSYRPGSDVPGNLHAWLVTNDGAGGGPPSPTIAVAAAEPGPDGRRGGSPRPFHCHAFRGEIGHVGRVADQIPHPVGRRLHLFAYLYGGHGP